MNAALLIATVLGLVVAGVMSTKFTEAPLKLKADIGIGDAVEVAVMERPAIATPFRGYSDDNPPPAVPPMTEKWLPATVVYADREQIGVTFSDGERLAIPRYSNKWRVA